MWRDFSGRKKKQNRYLSRHETHYFDMVWSLKMNDERRWKRRIEMRMLTNRVFWWRGPKCLGRDRLCGPYPPLGTQTSPFRIRSLSEKSLCSNPRCQNAPFRAPRPHLHPRHTGSLTPQRSTRQKRNITESETPCWCSHNSQHSEWMSEEWRVKSDTVTLFLWREEIIMSLITSLSSIYRPRLWTVAVLNAHNKIKWEIKLCVSFAIYQYQ